MGEYGYSDREELIQKVFVTYHTFFWTFYIYEIISLILRKENLWDDVLISSSIDEITESQED